MVWSGSSTSARCTRSPRKSARRSCRRPRRSRPSALRAATPRRRPRRRRRCSTRCATGWTPWSCSPPASSGRLTPRATIWCSSSAIICAVRCRPACAAATISWMCATWRRAACLRWKTEGAARATSFRTGTTRSRRCSTSCAGRPAGGGFRCFRWRLRARRRPFCSGPRACADSGRCTRRIRFTL